MRLILPFTRRGPDERFFRSAVYHKCVLPYRPSSLSSDLLCLGPSRLSLLVASLAPIRSLRSEASRLDEKRLWRRWLQDRRQRT